MRLNCLVRGISAGLIFLAINILLNDDSFAVQYQAVSQTIRSDSIAVDAAGDNIPATFGASNTTMSWSVQGNQAGAALGTSVGSAGDVNADGFADVIVGAPGSNSSLPGTGRVFIFNGSASGLSELPSWWVDGDQSWSSFGAASGTAGDINGDGYSDVIVGMPRYSGGQQYEGKVFVYYGSENGPSPVADWTYESNQTEARFGSVVGTAGDVNGDGYADVIVGAYNAGRVYVFHGSANGLSTTADWSIWRGGYLGWAAATAGDVNGDGYDDVIVGSKLAIRGQADVYYGSANGLDTSAAWTVTGEHNQAWFGYSVGSAGDVNGDGYSDVIVGNERSATGAYIFHGSASGLNLTADWTVKASQPGEWFSPAVVGPAGDVNADGYDDVFVRVYAGLKAYVFYGSESGVGDADPGVTDFIADFPGSGRSPVGAAGDVNRDGYADIIIGSDEYGNGQTGEGRAVLYNGSASGLQIIPSITIDSMLLNGTVGISFYLHFSRDDWYLAPEGTYIQWFLDGVDQGPWYEDSPIFICGLSPGQHTASLRLVWPEESMPEEETEVSFTVVPSFDAGTLKWIFSTGDRTSYTAPALGPDGTIYCGSADNNLYALEPNGCLKWSVPVASRVTPTVGEDGTVYVTHGKVSAFSPDGVLKWVFDQAANSPVAIGKDGTLYTKGSDNFLYAIHSDGAEKWKFPIERLWGGGPPAIGANGTVYVGSADNHLYAVLPNGSLQWRFPTAGWLYESSIAIGDDGSILAGSTDGYLYAVNPDGTEKWKFYSPLSKTSQVIGSDGTVYTMDGKWLWAVLPDGTTKWNYEIGSGGGSSPVIGSDGLIYILASDLDAQINKYKGRLHAVSPEGIPQWVFEFDSISLGSSPVIAPDGTVYFGSDDGNIYAVNSGSAGLANSAWPMLGHDQGHTGRYVGPSLPPISFPNHGGDDGWITVRIDGGGFSDGSAVKLARKGEQDIEGNAVQVTEDGLSIFTTFNLTDKSLGLWDLVITSPDETEVILPDGFTIEPAKIQLWAEIIGSEFIRPGRPQSHWINYGNSGNVDIRGAHLFIEVPAGVAYKFDNQAEFQNNPTGSVLHFLIRYLPAQATDAFQLILELAQPELAEFKVAVAISNHLESFMVEHLSQYDIEKSAGDHIPVFTGALVSAGSTFMLDSSTMCEKGGFLQGGQIAPDGYVGYFIVQDGTSLPYLQVGLFLDGKVIWSNPFRQIDDGPFQTLNGDLKSIEYAQFNFNTQGHAEIEIKTNNVSRKVKIIHAFSIRPFHPRLDDASFSKFETHVLPQIRDNLAFAESVDPPIKFASPAAPYGQPPTYSCIGLVTELIYGEFSSRFPILRPNEQIPYLFSNGFGEFDAGNYWLEANVCKFQEFFYNSQDPTGTSADWRRWFESAKKELRKIGVSSFDPNEKIGGGTGVAKYISAGEPLRYLIIFENLETATAPAQEVIITDQLDTTHMNLRTLNFGPIRFGDRQVTPAAGAKGYSGEVDLRPEQNLLVRITAELNMDNGLLTWKLAGIDPDTGNLPEDPMVGFLPPNTNPPEGDGSVFFTVMLKDEIATGTQVKNAATILFDANPPIDIPEWLNLIDNSKPSSQVSNLPPIQINNEFEVQWSGSDEGAGLKDFSVYVSVDNGDFFKWLSNTADNSANFIGEDGKTYSFISTARDAAGNIEELATAPDTTTVVRIPCEGDFDGDKDVDGFDLANQFDAEGINIKGIAANFGRTDCP